VAASLQIDKEPQMGWKFWHKEEGAAEKAPKPSKPKDLPSPVGRTLVVDLKQNPDWVWSLKCVMRPLGSSEGVFEMRIFDPKQAWDRSIEIKAYNSLDDHPELILFSGTFRKRENLFEVMKQAA
jgi:hypothetical protein